MDNITGCRTLQARIAVLESALAEYAHSYGLTEGARAAFRAAASDRMDGEAESLIHGREHLGARLDGSLRPPEAMMANLAAALSLSHACRTVESASLTGWQSLMT